MKKKLSVKSRWHLVGGQVVSVRFAEFEHKGLAKRANGRGLSTGAYLKLLFRATKEGEEGLELESLF